MITEEIKNEVLEFMYDKYNAGTGDPTSITPITNKLGLNNRTVAQELESLGYLKNVAYIMQDVRASITIPGMIEVDSVAVSEKKLNILDGLNERGGKANLMDILDDEPYFQKASDFAKYLKDEGHINITLSNFAAKALLIEFTEAGRQQYDEEQPRFVD